MAAWAGQGTATYLLVLADGGKGTDDPSADLEALAELRKQELEEAAESLGLAGVELLGLPDGEVENDLKTRGRVVAILRRIRPDIVIAPDPTATFFGGVYVNHHDHRETGWLVLDSVAPACSMPHYFPEAGPPHRVRTLLLSGTLEADCVVDIAASLDSKASAVLAHRSQLDADDDWAREALISRATQAGRLVGLSYGEAFRHVDLDA